MRDDKPSPLLQAARHNLQRRDLASLEKAPAAHVVRWGNGTATLQEIKGYTEEELFSIAQHGYTLFLNGKVRDAQTVFEGLVAIDPRNEYYYRALGVVYHRAGAVERAIRQFSHALKLKPRSVAALVNRAEVHISRRDYDRALEDLEQAVRFGRGSEDPVVRKARALRMLLIEQHG